MEALSESFIFYKTDRFDIVGKQLLKTNSKWYIDDLGLRGYILSQQRYDLGFSILNIVCFELLRRGYQVNIEKLGKEKEERERILCPPLKVLYGFIR